MVWILGSPFNIDPLPETITHSRGTKASARESMAGHTFILTMQFLVVGCHSISREGQHGQNRHKGGQRRHFGEQRLDV